MNRNFIIHFAGLLLLAMTCAATALAQTTRGTLTVTPTSGVESNSVCYFYKGEQRGYAVEFTPASGTDSIVSARLELNGQSLNCGIDNAGKRINIPIEPFTCNVVSNRLTDTFVLHYQYSNSKDKKGKPVIEEASSGEIQKTYTVYEKPELKASVSIIGNYSAAIGAKEFTINATGIAETKRTGRTDGWTYHWEVNGEKEAQSDDKDNWRRTYTYSGTEEYKTYQIRLCLTNSIVRGVADPVTLYSDPVTIKLYKALNAEFTGNPENIVLGYTKRLSVKLTGGQKGKWKDVKFNINGKDVSTQKVTSGEDEFFADYRPEDVNAGDNINVTLSATNSPDMCDPVGINPMRTTTLHVWPEPEIKAYFDDKPHDGKGGDTTPCTLSIVVSGGCEAKSSDAQKNGWFYEWSRQDGVQMSETGNDFTLPSDPVDNIHTTFSVNVKHYVDNEPVIDQDFSKPVTIWAKPKQPSYEAHAFDGEAQAEIRVSPTSGYTGEDGGWRYTIKRKDSTGGPNVVDPTANATLPFSDQTFYCGNGYDDDVNDNYTLVAENYFKGQEFWDKFEIPLQINVHKQPEVSLMFENKSLYAEDEDPATISGTIDTYHTRGIVITVDKRAGIDGAWKCELEYAKNNDSAQHLEGGSGATRRGQTDWTVSSAYAANTGHSVEQGRLTGHITNEFGNIHKTWNVSLDVNVWPQVQWSEAFMPRQGGVREGDDYVVLPPVPMGGGYCPDGDPINIDYTYTVDLQELERNASGTYTINRSDISNMEPGIGKQQMSHTLSVKVTAYGPDESTEWDNRTYTKEITTYRRPQMPESLVMKGNGSSHTYIMTLPASESAIESDYNFVLTDGTTVYYSGPLRYAVCDRDTNLKAACYWTYDSNVTVYSDFRLYGSPFDEASCDWSTFNGEGPHARGTHDSDVDGIGAIDVDTLPVAVIRDMQGRTVTTPQHGSMYVVGGRKMIFK